MQCIKQMVLYCALFVLTVCAQDLPVGESDFFRGWRRDREGNLDGTGKNFGQGWQNDHDGNLDGTGKNFGQGWRQDSYGDWDGTGKNFGSGWRTDRDGNLDGIREFDFVPLWNIPVRFEYQMRRVNCSQCGVRVEQVPWADGKAHTTKAFELFLAQWARKLSWKETATSFGTCWDTVYRSVKAVVAYGLTHRNLDGSRTSQLFSGGMQAIDLGILRPMRFLVFVSANSLGMVQRAGCHRFSFLV